MSEGGLGAPQRRPIEWRDETYYDAKALDAETRRQFDVCHGCRRCFNLCDAFPRLFDLIDESDSGELDSVASADFDSVVDACTLCDMCFNKCPYIPPHEFNIDFPHLMLRHRAQQYRHGRSTQADCTLARTDRNGRWARPVAPLVNWATRTSNRPMRGLMEKAVGVHREAHVPAFHTRTLVGQAKQHAPEVNRDAPAFGRNAVIYATCYGNYNNPEIGTAARAVLARNGVETEVLHPGCCAMPWLEQGNLEQVAAQARKVAAEFGPWIDRGYRIVTLMPSCALMLRSEWPLLLPDDKAVARLIEAVADVAEYVVDISRNEGVADGLQPLPGGVAVHWACHARAQYIGPMAMQMLRLIPDADLEVIDRCSGHGGAWGVKKAHFETALKVGRPVVRKARDSGKAFLASECPLAGAHIVQGLTRQADAAVAMTRSYHPIQLLARAYGLPEGGAREAT